MSRSGDLFELQTIDSLLDQNRQRRKQIIGILKDNTEIKEAENKVLLAEKKFSEAEKKLKKAEQKVKDQRLKIKSTDAKLYGGKITNPKELNDLQNESEALSRYLNILEDRQLEAMIELDEYAEHLQNASRNLENLQRKAENLHHELYQEKEQLETEIGNLESRRATAISTIVDQDLQRYERLRQKGHGVAVAKVNNGSCSACGATLTAALNQAARSPNQITICQTCGRILFS